MSKVGNGPTRHAYMDESRRGARYLLTASLIASRDVAKVTKAVKESLPNGRRRAHFSDEGPKLRRRILDSYCRLPTTVAIAVAEYRGGDDQAARNECFKALLGAFVQLRVRVAVLDTRGPDRDAVDRRFIAQALREGHGPSDLQYSHRGSRDEPLLGLPDVFGWRYGAGGAWQEQVVPLLVAKLGA